MPDDDDLTRAPEAGPDASADRDDPSSWAEGQPPSAVSLMITRRQKQLLRDLGFSEGEIREMTPAEAHAHLGL